MTSINAMRINDHSGWLLCDEGRFWNPEWMILQTPEKIRSVTSKKMTEHSGVIAFIGSTGASSFGDEIMDEVALAVQTRFDEADENEHSSQITTVRGITELAWEVVRALFHKHRNDFLMSRFGIPAEQVISVTLSEANETDRRTMTGSYYNEMEPFLTLDSSAVELAGLRNNAQIIAGYDSIEGFSMFVLDERMEGYEQVGDIFIAQGSGRIAADLTLSAYAAGVPQEKRLQGTLPAIEALVVLLEGLINAADLAAGIVGYPKVIYIDGKAENVEDRIREICDWRSFLAMELVKLHAWRDLSKDTLIDYLQRLLFSQSPSIDIITELEAQHLMPSLHHQLRGYPAGDSMGGMTK